MIKNKNILLLAIIIPLVGLCIIIFVEQYALKTGNQITLPIDAYESHDGTLQ